MALRSASSPTSSAEREDAFVAAAEHRQRAVRRDAVQRFGVFEVVARTWRLPLPCRRPRGRPTRALPATVVAQRAEQVGVFGEALHQDVLGAFERAFTSAHALFGIDEGAAASASGRQRRVVEQASRPAAPGRLRGRSAPWCGASACRAGTGLRAGSWCRRPRSVAFLRRQLALLLDAREDGGAPLLELAQVAQALSSVRSCVSSRPPVASLR